MAVPHCGICGSIDVVMNETGLFVCNDCGARFTIEAMRNLMNEDLNSTTNEPKVEAIEPSEPTYRFGDENSDSLVEQYESGHYELAAATWKMIKEDIDHLDPLVILLGEMAEGLCNDLEEPIYCSTIYTDFRTACYSHTNSPTAICSMIIRAVGICAVSPQSRIKAQQSKYNYLSRTRDYDHVDLILKYVYAFRDTIRSIDAMRIYALIDILHCVINGYVLSNDDWDAIREQINDIDAVDRIPLLGKTYSRLIEAVSTKSIPSECTNFATDDDNSQITEYARRWWRAGDYDLATLAYGRLITCENYAVAIEAKTALALFAYSLEDLGSDRDFRRTLMANDYKAACDSAVSIGGPAGSDLLKHLTSVGGIFTYYMSFYLKVVEYYVANRDSSYAGMYKNIGLNYADLTKMSYSYAFEKLSAILDQYEGSFDTLTVAYWKALLVAAEKLVEDDEVRTCCLHKLKEHYVRVLEADETLADEIAAKRSEADSRKAEIESRRLAINADISELEEARQAQEGILAELVKDMAERKRRSGELQTEISAIYKEISTFEATYKRLSLFAGKKKGELRSKIEASRNTISEMNETLDSNLDEIDALKAKAEECQSRIEDIEAEIATLSKKLSDAQAEIEGIADPILEIAELKWQSLDELE